MQTTVFASAKVTITNAASETAKLAMAKQVTQNNCLSPAQIVDVMQLFTFESTKLDFSKFAYDFTTDKRSYYDVSDGLTSESAKTELDNFIESKVGQ